MLTNKQRTVRGSGEQDAAAVLRGTARHGTQSTARHGTALSRVMGMLGCRAGGLSSSHPHEEQEDYENEK